MSQKVETVKLYSENKHKDIQAIVASQDEKINNMVDSSEMSNFKANTL